MNIVIPMAGDGLRFAEAGYLEPKPFLRPTSNKKSLIEYVIANVELPSCKFYLLVRPEHVSHLLKTELIKRKNISFILIPQLTDGAACTVLQARDFINSEEPLIIANSDQFVEYDKSQWIDTMTQCDGGAIMCFKANHPKWSYAKINEHGSVIQVAEKELISNNATVGIYYYKQGRYFVEAAEDMIARDIRVKGEFYVAPCYNYIIQKWGGVKSLAVINHYGLGTPEDFIENASYLP